MRGIGPWWDSGGTGAPNTFRARDGWLKRPWDVAPQSRHWCNSPERHEVGQVPALKLWQTSPPSGAGRARKSNHFFVGWVEWGWPGTTTCSLKRQRLDRWVDFSQENQAPGAVSWWRVVCTGGLSGTLKDLKKPGAAVLSQQTRATENSAWLR